MEPQSLEVLSVRILRKSRLRGEMIVEYHKLEGGRRSVSYGKTGWSGSWERSKQAIPIDRFNSSDRYDIGRAK